MFELKDPKCRKCGGQMFLNGEFTCYHWVCEECGLIRIMQGSDRKRVIEFQESEGMRVIQEGRTLRVESYAKTEAKI